jgi:hypothetical protein
MSSKVPRISEGLYGGIIEYDSSGPYPGLELINFIFCNVAEDVLPQVENVEFVKRTHDLARRLVWDYEEIISNAEATDFLSGDDAPEILKALLSCLQLPIHNSKQIPAWHRAHFFPYSQSLVHWDARIRGNKPAKPERKYLRGAGALLYKILRSDPDPERLGEITEGLNALFPDKDSTALGRLTAVLESKGTRGDPAEDDIESKLEIGEREPFFDIYNDGINNILSHREVSSTERVRAIINWSALWLALHQLRCSARFISSPETNLLIDCCPKPSQLRRESSRQFKSVLSSIDLSIINYAKQNEITPLPRAATTKLRGFFWSSAGAIGLINSTKGTRRYFTIKIELLETLILAATSGCQEIEYENFITEFLFKKCGLLIGQKSAQNTGLVDSIDLSIFEANEQYFAEQVKATGMLTDYSDSTRMIGTRNFK